MQLTAEVSETSPADGSQLYDKDRAGFTVTDWLADPRSTVFSYGQNS